MLGESNAACHERVCVHVCDARECCVINLGVITTFVSLWGLFAPLIRLFIPASLSLRNSDLCSPNSWPRLLNNKKHVQSITAPY